MTHELSIEGMTCGHCVRAIETALRSIPGVTEVDVSIGRARVEGEAERETLVRAIEEEGYRVPPG